MVALHIYPSTLLYESRIFKMAQTQVSSGLYKRVIIVGIHEAGLSARDYIAPGVERHRVRLSWPRIIPGLKTVIYFAELYHKLFWQYRSLKPDIVQVHSLSVLLPGVLLKWATTCKLVYDAHELETESYGLKRGQKRFAKWAERLLIKYADRVLVVSPGIADWYQKAYRLSNVVCIRNIPCALNDSEIKTGYFRTLFKIPSYAPLFIYTGALNYGRSISDLLDAFACFPQFHIVFMGYGILENTVKNYKNANANIHFHQAVNYDEVSLYASGADVGIVLSENICLSYYYGYANKQFEYLQAGLAIIASDFPDMGGFVRQNKLGWVCTPERESIKQLLSQIKREEIRMFKGNAKSLKHAYTWEKEGDLYLMAIRNLT